MLLNIDIEINYNLTSLIFCKICWLKFGETKVLTELYFEEISFHLIML